MLTGGNGDNTISTVGVQLRHGSYPVTACQLDHATEQELLLQGKRSRNGTHTAAHSKHIGACLIDLSVDAQDAFPQLKEDGALDITIIKTTGDKVRAGCFSSEIGLVSV